MPESSADGTGKRRSLGRGSALRLVTAVALNVTANWPDRRYLDVSLLKAKELAIAKAA